MNIRYGRHLEKIFEKISFGPRDLFDVRCRGESKQKNILLSVYRDFVLLVRNLAGFDYLNGKYSQ